MTQKNEAWIEEKFKEWAEKNGENSEPGRTYKSWYDYVRSESVVETPDGKEFRSRDGKFWHAKRGA